MRIGLVSDTYTPQVNGVTTVVRRIVSLLRAQGHEALVVAPRYPAAAGSPDHRVLRIRSLALPLYPDIRMSLPPFRQVGGFFDAAPPDVVHVHTEGALGLAGRRYALRRGLPLVTSFRTNFPEYSRHYGVGFLESAVWRWLQWFHRPARVTFTPGEAIRDDLVRRGLSHAALWGRGVDPHFFHPGRRDHSWRRWLAGGDDTLIVLHVGRLAHEKNLGVLIEAWRQAYAALGQRATFVVAGEGPEARRIESRLPFVRLLGFLPREDLATLYASADVSVFPSHTETCGLVALEAMASGSAVIAADAGGFRESIQPGTTGLLVSAQCGEPDTVSGAPKRTPYACRNGRKRSSSDRLPHAAAFTAPEPPARSQRPGGVHPLHRVRWLRHKHALARVPDPHRTSGCGAPHDRPCTCAKPTLYMPHRRASAPQRVPRGDASGV